MFWNDPNLYSVAFKDIPHFPTPFLGAVPRLFQPYPPYLPPQVPQMFFPQYTTPYFTPPMTPPLFNPQMFNPQMFNPQLFTPPPTPFANPMLSPYNFSFFDRYRPFGI